MKITIVIAGLLLVPFAFTQNAAKDPDVERREAVAHEVNVIFNQRDWTTMTVECLGENETELAFVLPQGTWAPGSMWRFAHDNITPNDVEQLKSLGFKSVRLSGAQLTPTDSTGKWVLTFDDPNPIFHNAAPLRTHDRASTATREETRARVTIADSSHTGTPSATSSAGQQSDGTLSARLYATRDGVRIVL
jgi:hypothetical protein